jgi:hypothetical protein
MRRGADCDCLASTEGTIVDATLIAALPSTLRYRGLSMNEQHLFSQFALVNLFMGRHALAPDD